MTYAINQLVRCKAEFHAGPDATGALTNPTTVTFKLLSPSGTETDYTWPGQNQVVNDSAGLFHVDVLATMAGTWTYRFNGTGAVVAAREGTFFVDASAFPVP